MFGCRVGCETRRAEQAAHRRDEDDFAAPLRGDPFPYHRLGERQRPENVDLEIMPHDIERNFSDRAALPYAGVIDEDIKIPVERMLNIVGIQNIQFLDTKRRQVRRFGLGPQCRDLGPGLSGCNDLIARRGKSQRRPLTESGTGTRDQNLSRHFKNSSAICRDHSLHRLPEPRHRRAQPRNPAPPDRRTHRWHPAIRARL